MSRRVVEARRYVDGDMVVIAEVFDDGMVRFSIEASDKAFSLGAAVLEQLATLAHGNKTAPTP